MKFEVVYPTETEHAGSVEAPPRRQTPLREPDTCAPPAEAASSGNGQQGTLRARMGRPLDGARASLDRLRAHAVEQATAESPPASPTSATDEADVELVLYRERFSARWGERTDG